MSHSSSPRITALIATFFLATALFQIPASAVAPSTPTEVAITESTNTVYNDGQLTVTWKAVTNATGYAAKITRQGTTTPIVISTDGNSNTRALFTGLLGGATYLVQVQALTGVDASAFTATVNAVPKTLPKAPSKPTVVKGIGQATVSWTALTANETGGFDVTSYVVTELNSKKTTTVNGTTTSTIMTGLSNGAAVEFTVTAVTAASSTGATSDKSDRYTLDDVPGAPEAPVVALTTTSGEVRATWNAPTTDGGSAILSFTVRLFKDGVENASKLIDKISDTFHTFTALLAGKYTAKVTATNAVGDSALSALSNEVEIGAVASPTPTASTSATPTPTPSPTPTPTPTPSPTPSATESVPAGGGGGGGFFGGGGGGALPPAVAPLVSPSAIPSPSVSPSPSISPTLLASPTPIASPTGVLPRPSVSPTLPSVKPSVSPGTLNPTIKPSALPSQRPTEKPTPLPLIKPNSFVSPVQVTAATKQIPISSSITTSTVVQPNKSLSVSIPAVKAGTKVALTMKGPDGKTITIPTPKVSKSGTYKLPALQFKKPGTYTMTVKVGSATKTIKVTVPKAK